jgi:hypothetical protein
MVVCKVQSCKLPRKLHDFGIGTHRRGLNESRVHVPLLVISYFPNLIRERASVDSPRLLPVRARLVDVVG